MVYCKIFEIMLLGGKDGKEEYKKKVKITALIFNILVTAALIFLEVVFYDIASYKTICC